MPNYYRLLTYQLLTCVFCFFSLRVEAMEVFFDPLYWQATETVEWVLSNSLSAPNQTITYKTIQFPYKTGYRAGIGFHNVYDDWNTRLYYTGYQTSARNSATGNLVSTFLSGKFAPGNGNFFNAGQVYFKIAFNMFDWDLYKPICATEDYSLSPILGLRGGSIRQNVITYFQGAISITENVSNHFIGAGPKIGLEGKWVFYRFNAYQLSLFSEFTSSYLWGEWRLKDATFSSGPTNFFVNNRKRNFGAFTLQGIVGLKLDYDCWRLKLGYEASDWFNQFQVFDDGTGGHTNDLILQGLTLGLSYCF